jgi:hypothetical protein
MDALHKRIDELKKNGMFMFKEDWQKKRKLDLKEELNQFRNRDNSTVHKTLFYCV